MSLLMHLAAMRSHYRSDGIVALSHRYQPRRQKDGVDAQTKAVGAAVGAAIGAQAQAGGAANCGAAIGAQARAGGFRRVHCPIRSDAPCHKSYLEGGAALASRSRKAV